MSQSARYNVTLLMSHDTMPGHVSRVTKHRIGLVTSHEASYWSESQSVMTKIQTLGLNIKIRINVRYENWPPTAACTLDWLL